MCERGGGEGMRVVSEVDRMLPDLNCGGGVALSPPSSPHATPLNPAL